MKRPLLYFIPLFFTAHFLFSQESPNLIDLEFLYQGNRINVFDLRPRSQEGTFYFSNDWMEGAILYKNGKVLTDHLIRYNQKNNSVEINSSIGILTLPGYYIEEFTMQKSNSKGEIDKRMRFVNPATFNGGYAFNIGFLQELQTGGLSLYSAHKAELVRPDYVPILSSGSTRSRIIKRKKHFLYTGQKLIEIPKGKRKIIKTLEQYCPGVTTFIKNNKMNPKRKNDLIEALNWCNNSEEH